MALEPEEFSSRTAPQEVDTVEICPVYPDFMVYGTYALIKEDEHRPHEAQVRKGLIQVLPVGPTFKPKYPAILPPSLDKKSFSCAVLDIHFHPSDGTLLGVATSTAEMYFFRFMKHGDMLDHRIITKLIPLGSATIAPSDEAGLVPLVTQFTWFPEIGTTGGPGVDDRLQVTFAASTSFGDIKVVKTPLPAIKDPFDHRLAHQPPVLPVISADIQQHSLEAWTVAAARVPSTPPLGCHILLSGGDDSALIASRIELDTVFTELLTTPPRRLWTDKRTHNAGVVAILPLPTMIVTGSDNGLDSPKSVIPVLTGSYDERVRIYEINTITLRATLKTDLQLDGGVWRLKLMDDYTVPADATSAGSSNGNNDDHSDHAPSQHHFLILLSNMHGGAKILRVTHTHAPGSSLSWEISVETQFRRGHESIVYACDAIRDGHQRGHHYTVVSTSFYDMKICTWSFVDRMKDEAKSKKGLDKLEERDLVH